MNPNESKTVTQPDCPKCGSEMYQHTDAPGVTWCDTCQREFWREGGDWWSCDASGVLSRVQ